MARVARIVAVEHPHHITQRGNNRQIVFNNDTDRKKYLTLVKKYMEQYKISVLSYCLMPNHVHLVVIPHKKDSLAKTFNFAHMRYSQYFNKKTDSCGHLWQGRFYSCILDEPHLIMAARYIERNPVRAKMVKKAWQWKWSSAAYNAGMKEKDILVENPLAEYIGEKQSDWKKRLEERDSERFIKQIKMQTAKGLPLALDGFIGKLEEKLGRNLKAKPRGRPWNERNN